MADTGKVLVFYREEKTVCLDEDVVIVEETPEGITVRHTYRKGTRLEFIPRERLEGIVYEDVKPDRNPRKAKVAKPPTEPVAKPTPEPVVEPVVEPIVEPAVEDDGLDNILSESEDFDDDGDDFDDDDEFE